MDGHIFDATELFKALFKSNKKRGRKLAELTPKEVAEMQTITARGEQLCRELEKINLTRRELMLESDKWWSKVREDHKIDAPNLNYDKEENAVYEMVDQDSERA